MKHHRTAAAALLASSMLRKHDQLLPAAVQVHPRGEELIEEAANITIYCLKGHISNQLTWLFHGRYR